ncbi:MAG TPA: monovalent cation/H+ antiporter subunit D family protein [Actinomycetospora sp.]|nr:monovalent cation/H+ antiporter subunit D family protein [Actinomycetospora sp.]
MTVLLPMLVIVPVAAASVLVLLTARSARPSPGVAVVVPAVLVLVAAGAVALIVATADGVPVATAIGLWPPGVAIPFVADALSALLLLTTAVLSLACTAFALASGEAERRWFGPLVLVLTAGVNGALLTGDLFNLFVFVEVMLLPSYGLMILARARRGSTARVAGTRLFVVVNLLASTLLLAGVGLTYGTAGTVVLAELAGAAQRSGTVAVAVALVLLALAVKSAVVPFHGWLANTYPAASPAVTALFSGLHTKIAIYAIYRIYAVVFAGDALFLWVGLVLFSATMVIGVLGAVGETTTRSILVFHMVSQIGYILLGLAIFGPLGLAAGIFYLIHNMVAKTSLFLSTGAVETRYGGGELGRWSGLARREPLTAVAFFVGALALAGLPPLSGFVAKTALVLAAVDAGRITVAVLAVGVSLLTLLSMLKIWTSLFTGEVSGPDDGSGGQEEDEGEGAGEDADSDRTGAASSGSTLVAVQAMTGRRIGTGLIAPGLVLAAFTVVLGVGAQPLFALCEVAAAGLVDTSAYVAAVLEGDR